MQDHHDVDDADDPAEWMEAWEGECDHCHQRRPVEFLEDPYLGDIHDEIEMSYWCRPCHEARAADR